MTKSSAAPRSSATSRSREREWRERDSLRGAALKGRDRDGDGIPDSKDPVIGKVDKNRDGIDDRVE